MNLSGLLADHAASSDARRSFPLGAKARLRSILHNSSLARDVHLEILETATAPGNRMPEDCNGESAAKRKRPLMNISQPALTVFQPGDSVILAQGSYQGTRGVFLRLRPDPRWADIVEANGQTRNHPLVWLAHFPVVQ